MGLRITNLMRFAAVLGVLASVAPSALSQPDSIDLSASPSAILADGHSSTVVTARVFDRAGGYVPDGTVVEFTAELGNIERSASTLRGVARVRLISSQEVGSSLVVATAGTATATVYVEFAAELKGAYEIPAFIAAQADYLAYSVDFDILDCVDNVRITSGPIEITAQSAQVDAMGGIVYAWRDVTVRSGEASLSGDVLVFATSSGEGEISGAPLPEPVWFSGPKLEPKPSEEVAVPPMQTEPVDLYDSQMLMTARRARIFPAQKVQLARANIFVYGAKVLKLPHYEYTMGGFAGAAGQYFGIGSDGLSLAFPYTFSMTPTAKSSLVISRGAHMGWGSYSSRQGWALGLSHTYDVPSRAAGEFALQDVSRPTWGARWQETREFGPGFAGFFDFESPNHRDLFGNLSLSKQLRALSLSLSLSGSRYEGADTDLGGHLLLETAPARFWQRRGQASLLFRINRASEGASPLFRKSHSLFLQTRTTLLGGSLRGSSLSLTASVGQVWGGSDVRGTALQGGLAFGHNFGRGVSFRANYSYSKLPWLADAGPTRQVSSVLSVRNLGNFDAHAYYLWNLDADRTNFFAGAAYRFSPLWRVSADLTRQSYADTRFTDYEIGLGRQVGLGSEARVVWSNTRRRLYFEFTGGVF
jgi:hypothetical protein